MHGRPVVSAISIRPAGLDDLPAVRRVLVETWHDTYDPLLGRNRVTEITDQWHSVGVLAQQLDGSQSSFLLAERAGEIVGHAFGHARHPPTLFLGRLYVLPQHQRKGVGGALLAALVARHPGLTRIRLTVEVDNAKGVAFYRGQGFTFVGEVTEDALRSWRMERAIAP